MPVPNRAIASAITGNWLLFGILIVGGPLVYWFHTWRAGVSLRLQLLDNEDYFPAMYTAGAITVRKNAAGHRYVYRFPDDWRLSMEESPI